jgi:hypothetical protein
MKGKESSNETIINKHAATTGWNQMKYSFEKNQHKNKLIHNIHISLLKSQLERLSYSLFIRTVDLVPGQFCVEDLQT